MHSSFQGFLFYMKIEHTVKLLEFKTMNLIILLVS